MSPFFAHPIIFFKTHFFCNLCLEDMHLPRRWTQRPFPRVLPLSFAPKPTSHNGAVLKIGLFARCSKRLMITYSALEEANSTQASRVAELEASLGYMVGSRPGWVTEWDILKRAITKPGLPFIMRNHLLYPSPCVHLFRHLSGTFSLCSLSPYKWFTTPNLDRYLSVLT